VSSTVQLIGYSIGYSTIVRYCMAIAQPHNHQLSSNQNQRKKATTITVLLTTHSTMEGTVLYPYTVWPAYRPTRCHPFDLSLLQYR